MYGKFDEYSHGKIVRGLLIHLTLFAAAGIRLNQGPSSNFLMEIYRKYNSIFNIYSDHDTHGFNDNIN